MLSKRLERQRGCLIGLDLGSSAIKGVLIDNRGKALAESGAENRLLAPREGWVELAPEEHYGNVCRALRELAAQAPGGIAAVAMAAASGNTLLTDSCGKPLGNIISWMDKRAAQQPGLLSGLDALTLRRIVGWPCLTSFPLAQLAWQSEHFPGSLERAGHVGMDTDWLIYRLTGRWVMDHSTATTFHLQDQLGRSYHAPFLEMLGVRPGQLSELVCPGVAVGAVLPGVARETGLQTDTLIVAGCFDHPAAARAMGVCAPGRLMFSCGTSWVGFVPCGDREAVLDAQMLCDPFLTAGGGPWGGMFSVPCIGATIDWYVRNVIAPGEAAPAQVFDALAARSAPGAGGLRIDLREPPRVPRAGRAEISRAVMEGAARLLHEKMLALEGKGGKFRQAVMVGGPARSPVWPGIVAEITGLEVEAGGRDAGARGAAMLAGIGAGFYRDEQEALAVWNRNGGKHE